MRSVLSAFFVIITLFGCSNVLKSAPVVKFESERLVVIRNASGIGGRLAYKEGGILNTVYEFEKTIKYLMSPDGKKIAVTDTGGTAAFSIFIVNPELKIIELGSLIYKLKPILKNYSSVYPEVIKWISGTRLLLRVDAYGPFRNTSKRELNFKMEIELKDD